MLVELRGAPVAVIQEIGEVGEEGGLGLTLGVEVVLVA